MRPVGPVQSIRLISTVTSTPSPRGICRSASVGARPGATGRRGWSAHDLAQRLVTQGVHHISRSIPADLEIARRENISVAELLAFAVVPDVAPVHLLVPPESAEPYAVTTVTLDPGRGVDTRHEAAARH